MMWTINRFIAVKRELNLMVYPLIYIPTLTCGPKLWVVN